MSKNSTKSEDLPYRLGVGAVLFNAKGQVFVAKRIDTPGDAWQMPQGGIDHDEDPNEAIWRELKEEIGTNNAEIIAQSPDWLTYELPKAVQKKVWKGRYRGQKQKWYALRYLGDDSDIDLTADKHPEFSTWKWADFESIPDLIVEFKRDLYQDIVATFKHLNVKD